MILLHCRKERKFHNHRKSGMDSSCPGDKLFLFFIISKIQFAPGARTGPAPGEGEITLKSHLKNYGRLKSKRITIRGNSCGRRRALLSAGSRASSRRVVFVFVLSSTPPLWPRRRPPSAGPMLAHSFRYMERSIWKNTQNSS